MLTPHAVLSDGLGVELTARRVTACNVLMKAAVTNEAPHWCRASALWRHLNVSGDRLIRGIGVDLAGLTQAQLTDRIRGGVLTGRGRLWADADHDDVPLGLLERLCRVLDLHPAELFRPPARAAVTALAI